ncbi:MAG TPA: EAL domain-containing protein [Sphingomicrobium sp.]|nr:EAL domain-containing protein [Sphingomicrobium sp.]
MSEALPPRLWTARLRELCFLGFGEDPITRKLRRAQLEALARVLPVTNVVALFNAMLLVIALRNSVGAIDLSLWIGSMGLVVAVRIYHVVGGGRHQATPATVYLMVLASALMWSVPSLVWHDLAAPDERLMLILVTMGMMCGGCVTLTTMPLACWTFVLVLGSVMTALNLHVGQPIVAAMMVGMTLMLCWIGLRHALQFVEHQRDRIELEEQASLVELMREFEANGSGWLWETDPKLNVTYVSSDRSRWSLRRIRRMLNRHVRDILDPSGRVFHVSEGAQNLLAHFANQTPFRDIAVPTAEGRWWSVSGKPVYDPRGRLLGWRGIGSDISETRISGQDAVQAARRDPLTGLANRLLVREAVEEALLWSEGGACALMLVDLDRFKLVNDTLGHSVGDLLLKEVAARLTACVRRDALVGRLGGDEFALVFPGTIERERLAAIAERLIGDLSAVYLIGGLDLHIGATVGIAIAPEDAGSQEELATSADLALYRAKEEGRGTYRFYAKWMSELAQAHRQLESDLRGALQAGSLSLAYQPFVDAGSHEVLGYEALLRWKHPTLGDIPPDRFVPIIEDAGLMNQIGSWVIREACAEAANWPSAHRVAVNVSATQINGASLAATVVGALAESGLPAERLELEVTESIFLGEDDATLSALAGLRALGVRLAIDDFGKGYSSFGYLARAQFAKIKIDQSFVRGVAEGRRESVAIVEGMLALARGLGVETTAEGIETEREAQLMGALGCSQLQGFLFGYPEPAARRHIGHRAKPQERGRRRAAG